MSGSWTKERAKIASLSRSRPADDPEIIEARRNLKAIRLEEYVQKVVSEAPALTAEQSSKIAALLRPVGADAA